MRRRGGKMVLALAWTCAFQDDDASGDCIYAIFGLAFFSWRKPGGKNRPGQSRFAGSETAVVDFKVSPKMSKTT